MARTAADVVFAALSIELRRRLLSRMGTTTKTTKDLATELGVPLGNAAYHMRILRDAGLIELVRTEPRRGAIARHYRRAGKNQRAIDDLLALSDRVR